MVRLGTDRGKILAVWVLVDDITPGCCKSLPISGVPHEGHAGCTGGAQSPTSDKPCTEEKLGFGEVKVYNINPCNAIQWVRVADAQAKETYFSSDAWGISNACATRPSSREHIT